MSLPSKYLTQNAIEAIRDHISQAQGREVYMVGSTNDHKMVEEVTVFARGNEFSVPAIIQVAQHGDVVIHNHPSGMLEPSQADIAVASELGKSGVGFFIIDNTVSNLYAAVEAFDRVETKLLNSEHLIKLIGKDGLIAQKLPGYEFRPQQLEMIETLSRAFNENKIAIIEAGTGVGKTMAYLLPAIYWAVYNKERCSISTNTINLQEQLIKKDIPFLQSVLDVKFKAVLVKGRQNYACLRKVDEVQTEPELFTDDADKDELTTLIEWARKSKDGSKADLNFIPAHQTWEKISSESDTCTRTKCPHYQACFVNKARREASKADILVVNHHLLFADLSVRSGGTEYAVLPPYQRIVFDEAHHIEDVATNYFGSGITRAGIARILGRLFRERKGVNKGLLPFLMSRIRSNATVPLDLVARIEQLILATLQPAIEDLKFLNQELMESIFSLVKERTNSEEFGESQLRITPMLIRDKSWQSIVVETGKNFISAIRIFTAKISALLKIIEAAEMDAGGEAFLSQRLDIRAQADRLESAANTIEKVIIKQDKNFVNWLEAIGRNRYRLVHLNSSPLEVSEMLFQNVYEKFKTVVMTSATLTVEGIQNQGKFDYLENRIGLSLVNKTRRLEKILPEAFDYMQQALILVPLDIPEPNSREFASVLSGLIYRALEITQGKAFVLFTSYSLLNLLYNQLEMPLNELGLNVLKQGTENRHRLLQRFVEDTHSILFGTDSFWEGVDVRGEALEAVIITKLPFRVPTEPIIEARVEAIKRRGGNAFLEYNVPQAVIKFKQGFGRLIRHKSDRGAVLIFDKRVIEKYYGEVFLKSLPKCNIISGNQDKIFSELTAFFQSNPAIKSTQ
ncbi:DEAD/DEAH box helicase [candidate division KSB1 bacterium]|nr:DEAD/DEAH box helicase [candidate division KSB1 bacterium]